MKLELDIKFTLPEKFSPTELTELIENVTHALQHAVASEGLSPDSTDNYIGEFEVKPAFAPNGFLVYPGKTFGEVPAECLNCGQDTVKTAVDVTCYDGEDYQFNGPEFEETGEPAHQPVRCYCEDCKLAFRINKELADVLIDEATTV